VLLLGAIYHSVGSTASTEIIVSRYIGKLTFFVDLNFIYDLYLVVYGKDSGNVKLLKHTKHV